MKLVVARHSHSRAPGAISRLLTKCRVRDGGVEFGGVLLLAHNWADWAATKRLTLNIGVRWERFGQLGDKYGNLTNFWANDLRSVPIPPSSSRRSHGRTIG